MSINEDDLAIESVVSFIVGVVLSIITKALDWITILQ